MEKCIVWYTLWIKKYIRNKSYWFQLLGMIVVIGMVMMISVPDKNNMKVGIYCKEYNLSQQLMAKLTEADSVFCFQTYENTDALQDDVLSGKLECGFIFDERLEKGIYDGNLKGAVTYIGKSFSAKGEVAQETIYAAILKLYSDEILYQSQTDIYGDTDSVRMEKLLEKNHYYQESTEVFQLQLQPIGEQGESTQSGNVWIEEEQEGNSRIENIQAKNVWTVKKDNPDMVRGMVGLFVFFIVFLSYSNRFKEDIRVIYSALNCRESVSFSFTNQLAAGTVPAFIGMGILFLTAAAPISIVEVLKMILLLLISALWVTVIGHFFQDIQMFSAGIVPVLVSNLLLCPVFVDLSIYVSAFKYLQLLFPLGIYLSL